MTVYFDTAHHVETFKGPGVGNYLLRHQVTGRVYVTQTVAV